MRTILTGNNERTTPLWIRKFVQSIFNPVLDVCATKETSVCYRWFGPDHPDPACQDALAVTWSTRLDFLHLRKCVWMNPPYGRGLLGKFLAKAVEEAGRGVTTIALLPADTSTRWYHDYCLGRPTIFLKGRIVFGPGKTAAPFPSMIVIIHPPFEESYAAYLDPSA
jgi:phage N-6-adenine-methyltransferase